MEENLIPKTSEKKLTEEELALIIYEDLDNEIQEELVEEDILFL